MQSDSLKKIKSLDMTEGKPIRDILLFSVPVLIGNLFQQLYNLTDTNPLTWLMTSIMLIIFYIWWERRSRA